MDDRLDINRIILRIKYFKVYIPPEMNIFGTNINNKGKREKNQKVKEGPCIFPFKHQWKEHNECIDNENKGKICATSVSERGTLKTYGYCNERDNPCSVLSTISFCIFFYECTIG